LPRPEPGETYGDYLERLRELGWLGSADVEDFDTSGYPSDSAIRSATGAQIVRVTVGDPATSPVDMYDPAGAAAPWPVNPPVVSKPKVGIRIDRIAGDPPAPPAAGIDFGPITSIDP